jgi:DNA-binding HxlR family transcriptional regulator
MATKRTYGDGCAIAHALDLVGERWSLLVVRELLLGPKRFTDLKRGLPNASPNVISDRLRELERAGIVRRDKLPPPASAHVYALTDRGRELEEIVLALGQWGTRSPTLPREDPIGADSVVLSLKGMFDAGAAKGLDATYELRLGEDRFAVTVSDQRIDIARGSADRPDATIDSDPGTFFGVVTGGRSLADMTVEGDTGAVKRLLRLFPRPAPVA